jgi:cell division protein FtsW (lipid II flippase)
MVSYGGSSMVATFVAVGIILSVASRQAPVLARDDFS